MHELSIASAIVDTALRHADERRVTRVDVQVGALRQVVPGLARASTSRSSPATPRARGRGSSSSSSVPGCAARPAATSGTRRPRPRAGHEALAPVLPAFRCPRCERAETEVVRGGELEVESIEITEEETCIAPR